VQPVAGEHPDGPVPPHQNGQIGLATHKFAMFRNCPNIPSLPKKAGYRTGIIGKPHVNPASAFPFDFKEFTGSNFNKRPASSGQIERMSRPHGACQCLVNALF